MLKKIAATTAALLMLSNIAFAKFSDDYKAKYPKNVSTSTEQLPSGKMQTTTSYLVFDGAKSTPPWSPNEGRPGINYIKLFVIDTNGVKTCTLRIEWAGYDSWKDYDAISWGDGETAHQMPLKSRPFRGKTYMSNYHEKVRVAANPTDLTKAIVISAHRENGSSDIVFNQANKDWDKWKASLEDAEKLLAE